MNNDWVIKKAEESTERDLIERNVHAEESKIAIVPWRDFVKQEFEEPKWIVANLIPEKGLVAIAGSPESFKSFFSIYVAIKAAQGESVLGRYETTKTAVLLIDQESIPSWLHKRLTDLSKEEDLPIYIFDKDKTPLDLLNDDIFSQLSDFIKDNKIELVIIDTLRMAHSKEENSSTEMKPVVDRLKQLTLFTAVVFTHHHRKTDKFSRGKTTGEDMMGSIFIRGAVDYQLTLTNLGEQDDGSTRVRVAQTKARYTRPVKSFEMSLEDQDGLLTFSYKGDVEDEKLKKTEAKERIVELLAEEDIKRPDIIEQLDAEEICKSRIAEQALTELVAEKVIKHTTSKPHVYSLVENQTPSDSANRNSIYSLRIAESKVEPTQTEISYVEEAQGESQ